MSLTKLTADQFRQLEDALRTAFSSRTDLAQLTQRRLGEDLDAIIAPGNLRHDVFQLIEWAQAQGRLDELITGALQENPRNPALRSVAAALGVALPPLPPAAPPGAASFWMRLRGAPGLALGGTLALLALVALVFFLTQNPGSPSRAPTPTPPGAPASPTVPLATLPMTPLGKHPDGIWSVAFAPNGRLLAAGAGDGTVTLWDLREMQPLRRLNAAAPGSQLPALAAIPELPGNQVYSVAFSPDGAWVAGGREDGTVPVWDVESGNLVVTLTYPDQVRSLAFQPGGGELLAVATDDQRVWLARPPTPAPGTALTGEPAPAWGVAFNFDGQMLAAGYKNGATLLWRIDGTTGSPLLTNSQRKHDNAVTGVAFAPGGETLATGSWDRTVRLWPADSQELAVERTLSGPQEQVTSVAFAPFGDMVAAGSADRRVWVWDTTDGTLVYRLEGHENSVNSVAYRQDGLLASGSSDGTVRLWGNANPPLTAP